LVAGINAQIKWPTLASGVEIVIGENNGGLTLEFLKLSILACVVLRSFLEGHCHFCFVVFLFIAAAAAAMAANFAQFFDGNVFYCKFEWIL